MNRRLDALWTNGETKRTTSTSRLLPILFALSQRRPSPKLYVRGSRQQRRYLDLCECLPSSVGLVRRLMSNWQVGSKTIPTIWWQTWLVRLCSG